MEQLAQSQGGQAVNHLGDANKMVSDTPRTDEQINGKPCTRFEVIASDSLRNASVPSDFARQLERELNAANKRIKRLEKDSERLQWLLDRGLAWRDCYDEHWIEGEWLYASQDAIETIDKAKEAKP